MPISNLRIASASAESGVKVRNTDGFDLHRVRVKAEREPAVLIRDSTHLELDDVRASKMRLERCPGAAVRKSEKR